MGWDGSRDFVGLQRLLEDIERLIGPPQRSAAAPAAGALADGPPPAALPVGPVNTGQSAPASAAQNATPTATPTAAPTAAPAAAPVATPAAGAVEAPPRAPTAAWRPARRVWAAAALIVLAAGGAYFRPALLPHRPLPQPDAALPAQDGLAITPRRLAPTVPSTAAAADTPPAAATDMTSVAAAAAHGPAASGAALALAPRAGKPRPAALAATRARCASLAERQALGEMLSGAAQRFVEKECRP